MKKSLLAKCSVHAFQNRQSCPFSANRATQHKKPDDSQLIANHPVFFVCMTIACNDGHSQKKAVGKFLVH